MLIPGAAAAPGLLVLTAHERTHIHTGLSRRCSAGSCCNATNHSDPRPGQVMPGSSDQGQQLHQTLDVPTCPAAQDVCWTTTTVAASMANTTPTRKGRKGTLADSPGL